MQASTKEGGTLRKLKNIEILETIEAATSLVDLSKSLDEIYSRNSILFPCFKDFKINDKQFKGPVWFLSKDSISALTEFVNSIQFNLLVSSLHSLSVLLISKHSKCSSSHLNDAIGCMVLIQLISKLYSGILFISVENNLRSCCQELCLQFNSTLADPTTSNCILWILEQQNVTKKSIGKTEFFNHPGGIGCWFDFYFPLLIVPETDKKSFQIASVSQTASLDYISLVTSSLSTLGHSTKVIVPKITVKHFLDLVKSATSKSILVTRENENRFATIANDILENLKRRLIDVEFTSGDFATVLGLVKDERIAMFCAWMVEKDVSSLSLDLVVSWRKLYLDFEQETEIVLNLLVKEGGFTREVCERVFVCLKDELGTFTFL